MHHSKGPMVDKKREELIARREPLFKELQNNPARTHIAIEIKDIDDQIAECTLLIKQKQRPFSK
jgi:hypothetical protein